MTRPHRSQTKELNRQRRVLRQLLVHDAGEAFDSDSNRWLWGSCTPTERSLLDLANGRPVSVPRSLRSRLGRRIGGGR